jgi:hypothetical protein
LNDSTGVVKICGFHSDSTRSELEPTKLEI